MEPKLVTEQPDDPTDAILDAPIQEADIPAIQFFIEAHQAALRRLHVQAAATKLMGGGTEADRQKAKAEVQGNMKAIMVLQGMLAQAKAVTEKQ